MITNLEEFTLANITLKRKKAWGDCLRSYKILLDGTEVGTIKQGHTWTHNCNPGQHSLQLKVDWLTSPKVDFEVTSDNQPIVFECRNNIIPMLAIVYILMPSRWIALTRTA